MRDASGFSAQRLHEEPAVLSNIEVTSPTRGNVTKFSVKLLAQQSLAGAERLHEAFVAFRAQRKDKGHFLKLISAHDEIEVLILKHSQEAWQVKLMHAIQNHKVQLTLMCLLVVDVLVVCFEIFLDLEYPECRLIKRDGLSCCPVVAAAAVGSHAGHDGLEHGRHHGHHALCEAGTEEGALGVGCDEHKYPVLHVTHQGLFATSVVILVLFEIELLLLMLAATPCLFFRNIFYALDVLVVTCALALELAPSFMADTETRDLLGLILLARIWRLVRISHGIFSTTHEADEGHIEKLEEEVHQLRKQLDELHNHFDQKDSCRVPTTSD
uniref:Voltage-gated H+ channel protein n=1 Tax=Coccolithus braarudii TaxID=221442 RepID=E2IJ90_9EUKA|nr:voltage-gated H+ channel protein [Coccolithus braarudii]